MVSAFQRIYRRYGTILIGFGHVAGYCTFIIMLLVASNSFMRKGLNHPLEGTLEITEALLPVIIFLSVALTQFERGHIRVSLFIRSLHFRTQHWLAAAAMLAGALFFLWAAIAAWGFAMESWRIKEQEWGSILIPLYPVKFVAFLGLSMLSFQFLLDALREAFISCGLIAPEVEPEIAETEM